MGITPFKRKTNSYHQAMSRIRPRTVIIAPIKRLNIFPISFLPPEIALL
jgi:hypothetical protein